MSDDTCRGNRKSIKQINKLLSWRAGVDNIGNVRLAEKAADFGYAIRGRTYFVNLRADF